MKPQEVRKRIEELLLSEQTPEAAEMLSRMERPVCAACGGRFSRAGGKCTRCGGSREAGAEPGPKNAAPEIKPANQGAALQPMVPVLPPISRRRRFGSIDP